MGSIIMNKYYVNSPSIFFDKKIAFLSDVHSDALVLEEIIEILKSKEVDILIIGGDLLDCLKDNNRNVKIKELLEEYAKVFEIYIAIGNHDIVYFNNHYLLNPSENATPNLNFWYYLNLNENINVSYFPTGKSTVCKWSLDNNVDLSILNMPIEYYWHKEPYDEFKEHIKVLDTINIESDKYNILVCHTPKNIVQNGSIDEYFKEEKRFDLILSGHIHGGLVPINMRKNESGKGLFGPYGTLLPEYSYGIINDDGIISLNTGGVVKVANKYAKYFNRFNSSLYPAEVEIINLKCGIKKSFTRVRNNKH